MSSDYLIILFVCIFLFLRLVFTVVGDQAMLVRSRSLPFGYIYRLTLHTHICRQVSPHPPALDFTENVLVGQLSLIMLCDRIPATSTDEGKCQGQWEYEKIQKQHRKRWDQSRQTSFNYQQLHWGGFPSSQSVSSFVCLLVCSFVSYSGGGCSTVARLFRLIKMSTTDTTGTKGTRRRAQNTTVQWHTWQSKSWIIYYVF